MSTLYQTLLGINDLFRCESTHAPLKPLQATETLGPPPSLGDETSLRHWLQGLLPILDSIADLTPVAIDDHLAALVRVAVEDDQAWSALYALLSLATGGRVKADVNIQTLEDKTGFDLATIMAIVQMVMRIIELLRN